MYNGLAEQYNKHIEHCTKMIGAIIEPVIIIFIGGIVGFIIIAMYSPIFNLSQILER
jgi:type IV pilus assembly protein PilC